MYVPLYVPLCGLLYVLLYVPLCVLLHFLLYFLHILLRVLPTPPIKDDKDQQRSRPVCPKHIGCEPAFNGSNALRRGQYVLGYRLGVGTETCN